MSVRQSLKSRIACYGEERQRRLEKLNNSPVPLRGKVMKLAHDNIMSGHQGVKKIRRPMIELWHTYFGPEFMAM